MDLNNYFDELNSKKHGFSKSEDFEKYSLYRCYINILARCRNENHPRYADYGGRGILCHFESLKRSPGKSVFVRPPVTPSSVSTTSADTNPAMFVGQLTRNSLVIAVHHVLTRSGRSQR